MTREELENIVRENKVSSELPCTDDPLLDLLKEIYYEGYCNSYNNTVLILQFFGAGNSGCGSDEFFGKNIDKIRRRIDAINEYIQKHSVSDQ